MRVPALTQRQVRAAPLPGLRQPAVPRANRAAGLTQAGQAIIGQVARKRQQAQVESQRAKIQADTVAVAHARNAGRRARLDAFSTPLTGLDHLKGRELWAASDPAREAFETHLSTTLNNLSPDQQMLAGPLFDEERLAFDERMNARLGAEYDAEAAVAFSDSLVLLRDSAVDQVGTMADPLEVGRAAVEELDAVLMTAGTSVLPDVPGVSDTEARRGVLRGEQLSKLHGGMIDTLIAEGEAEAAEEYYEAFREDLLPETRVKAANAVRGAAEGAKADRIFGEVYDPSELRIGVGAQEADDYRSPEAVINDDVAAARAAAEEAGLSPTATLALEETVRRSGQNQHRALQAEEQALFGEIHGQIASGEVDGVSVLTRRAGDLQNLTAESLNALSGLVRAQTRTQVTAEQQDGANALYYTLRMQGESPDVAEQAAFAQKDLRLHFHDLATMREDGSWDTKRFDELVTFQDELRSDAYQRAGGGKQDEAQRKRALLAATGVDDVAKIDPAEAGRMYALMVERQNAWESANGRKPGAGELWSEVLYPIINTEIEGQLTGVPVGLPGNKAPLLLQQDDIDEDYQWSLWQSHPDAMERIERELIQVYGWNRPVPENARRHAIIGWLGSKAPGAGMETTRDVFFPPERDTPDGDRAITAIVRQAAAPTPTPTQAAGGWMSDVADVGRGFVDTLGGDLGALRDAAAQGPLSGLFGEEDPD